MSPKNRSFQIFVFVTKKGLAGISPAPVQKSLLLVWQKRWNKTCFCMMQLIYAQHKTILRVVRKWWHGVISPPTHVICATYFFRFYHILIANPTLTLDNAPPNPKYMDNPVIFLIATVYREKLYGSSFSVMSPVTIKCTGEFIGRSNPIYLGHTKSHLL